MNIIKLILKILLPILLLIITLSFIFENMIVKTITKEIMSKKISGYILDEIIYDFNSDELFEIEKNIRKNKNCEKITSKYINIIISNIINEENVNLDIEKEIKSIIEKELNNKIDENKKENIYNYLEHQNIVLANRLKSNIPFGYSEYDLNLFLKTYQILTNIIFRIIIFIIIIFDILIIIFLEKNKSINIFKISLLITGVISLIIFIIIKLASNYIEQNITGGWVDNINMNLFLIFIFIEFILYFILNLKCNSKLVDFKNSKL